MTFTRVQLITDDGAMFYARAKRIEDALAKGSEHIAMTRVKTLMKKLLENPSEQTIGFFAEIEERWGHQTLAYRYLEKHWHDWVTTEQRFELIRYRDGKDPQTLAFINKFEQLVDKIEGLGYSISHEDYARYLVRMVDDNCKGKTVLWWELIKVTDLLYGDGLNVTRYANDLYEARIKRERTKIHG